MAKKGPCSRFLTILALSQLLRSVEPKEEVIDDSESMPGLGFLNDEYAHVAYHFSSFRQGARRWGEGELWLSLSGSNPRVRLKGYAYSPRFGHGEITLLLDSAKKVMYAFLKLGELREAQCMSFPFPRSRDDPERLRRLRWRQRQVADHWTLASRKGRNGSVEEQVLAVNWTKSFTLDLIFSSNPDGSPNVRGVDLRRADRTVKTVRVKDALDEDGRVEDGAPNDLFTMPYDNCTLVSKVSDPLLLVEIKPPHKKSSALGDLLLVLADRAAGGHWPRAFLALCAVVVPGDVAVMIEEPPPPDITKLDWLSFDYTAKVFRLGGNVSFDDPAKDLRDKQGNDHVSSGSLTLDLRSRSLRLHGAEQYTKVGPVVTDILAQGLAEKPQVWANIVLPAQGEHHCGVYDFPPRLGSGSTSLERSAQHGLAFVGIDTLGDEDCGIFAATLPRDRQVYIWVDMESDRPGEFLRAEVRKDGRKLRRVDIVHWDSVSRNLDQMEPEEDWNCSSGFQHDPFVHLGLRHLKSWSVELQDALRALRELPEPFVVLEMLALTGDTCLMVKEPDPPELWALPGLSFGYTLFLGGSSHGSGTQVMLGEGAYTMGHAAVDELNSRFQITANAFREHKNKIGSVNITLSFDRGALSVRVQQDGDDQCLILFPDKAKKQVSFRPNPAGIFDGVEQIGDSECDRFTYPGQAIHTNTTVKFWLSRENVKANNMAEMMGPSPMLGRVCQLEVNSQATNESGTALLYVSDWKETYRPKQTYRPNFQDTMECKPATEEAKPWVEFASRPLSVDQRLSSPGLWPAAAALGRLVQAFTILGVGVFNEKWIDDVMSRLVIHAPPKISTTTTTTTPAPLHLLSRDMTSVSFNFRSELKIAGDTHVGQGAVRANLVDRTLYLSSVAKGLSRGIPELTSEVFWSYSKQKLFARMQLGADGYQQCWQVAVLGPPELPSSESKNPFLHFVKKGLGKEVSDRDISDTGEKYIIYLDPWTVAELFTDKRSALKQIHFKDFKDPNKASSVNIQVMNWSSVAETEPLDPGDSWECVKVTTLDGGQNFLAWDIIRLLFPSA